jgi:hypothetical protein
MMFGQGGPVKVFVATRPVDFRKGIDGLALAVQEMFWLDPFCGAVFVFRSKRADRIKLLVWDQTGMVLVGRQICLAAGAGRGDADVPRPDGGLVRRSGRDPGAVPGAGHTAPQIRLPPVFKGRGSGACARACRARWIAHGTVHLLDSSCPSLGTIFRSTVRPRSSSDKGSNTQANVTLQHLIAVFCRPDDVIAVIGNAVAAGVVLHDRILGKMNLRPGSGSFFPGYDHKTILSR